MQTEFRFEYGPDTNYGTLTTPASGGAAVGAISARHHHRRPDGGHLVPLPGARAAQQRRCRNGCRSAFTTLAVATPSPSPSPSPSPGGTPDHDTGWHGHSHRHGPRRRRDRRTPTPTATPPHRADGHEPVAVLKLNAQRQRRVVGDAGRRPRHSRHQDHQEGEAQAHQDRQHGLRDPRVGPDDVDHQGVEEGLQEKLGV